VLTQQLSPMLRTTGIASAILKPPQMGLSATLALILRRRMKRIIYVQIIILFSFSMAAHAKEIIASQIPFVIQTEIDSLRNPNHYYYLADLPIKKTGELILTDSIQPSDNYITFSLMDTISGCKKNDLNFYLQVFEKILYYADAALAEAVGLYTWNFIKKRPDEFINHIDTLNNEQIMKWADYTFYEMYFAYSQEELKIKCQELVNKLKKVKSTKSVSCFEKELNNRIVNGL
jgi:hypothetical protein